MSAPNAAVAATSVDVQMLLDMLEILTKPSVDIVLAGRVDGIGRNASYRAARNGTLPSYRSGVQLRSPSELLLQRLGLQTTEAREAALIRIRRELDRLAATPASLDAQAA